MRHPHPHRTTPSKRPREIPPFVTEYMAAFNRVYPEKMVDVRSRRQVDGSRKYAVIINGEAGDRTLTETEMREAIVDFQR